MRPADEAATEINATELSSEYVSVTDINSCGVEITAGQNMVSFSRMRHLRPLDASTHGGPTSETYLSAEGGGLLRRNGSELRRSLRRINSITRRRLSPGKPGSGGSSGRLSASAKKHSHSADNLEDESHETSQCLQNVAD